MSSCRVAISIIEVHVDGDIMPSIVRLRKAVKPFGSLVDKEGLL